MNKTFSNSLFFIVLAAVFFAAVFVNNLLFKDFSVDLTEQKVFSLSPGTNNILGELDEPINLYFFLSDTSSKGMTGIRDYATRVQSLLREYERKANGKIKLEFIDPEPFSEAEDRAASFGLTAAPTGVGQDTVYFGLAGTNSLDDGMVISFFDPQKEAFLEYDISKLVYQLSEPEPIKLTLITDLQISGQQNPLTGQSTPPSVIYQQLQSFFDLTLISNSAERLPSDTDVLMVLHPQSMPESLTNSIDQYLMSGGKAMMFIDPHYESDPMNQMGAVGVNASSFDLLEKYGIGVNTADVVLDALTGLEVRAKNGQVIRHLGFVGLGEGNISRSDITSADLESINGASFGEVSILPSANKLNFLPLLTSSENAGLMSNNMYASTALPEDIADKFVNQQTQYVLAARIQGSAESIIAPSAQTDMANFIDSTNDLNIVVVADADITADRFWVQQSNFFGQNVFSPFANNGDLIINVLENLGGSEGLIGIRSRGSFARPFTKVQDIQVLAEEKFRQQEQRLQAQLAQTETQLAELQTQSDSLTLSAQQQQAIDDFTQQKIAIRKSLRDVQYQLDKDIDELGNILKIINIIIAPLVLIGVIFVVARLARKKAAS
ncbi:MAG: Gldg family protein [Glaciecola sp.]